MVALHHCKEKEKKFFIEKSILEWKATTGKAASQPNLKF